MARVAVIRVAGTNCDEETAYAFRLAGAETEIIHTNELLKGRRVLEDYQILAIPGGFSYGDDISAAILWANQLRYKLKNDLKRFVESGKLVIGICNGFQVLVKAGLLPSFKETVGRQEATLAFNDIGNYHDRWVWLKHCAGDRCPFTQGIQGLTFLPAAHAEGKFLITDEGLKRLEEYGQIVFKYTDDKGMLAGYPWNPNGSIGNIAGICNLEGNVFGLMPHPERYIHKYMHPLWTSKLDLDDEGEGLRIFKNAVIYASKRF